MLLVFMPMYVYIFSWHCNISNYVCIMYPYIFHLMYWFGCNVATHDKQSQRTSFYSFCPRHWFPGISLVFYSLFPCLSLAKGAGLPDFSWHKIPKRGKYIPNYHKIYQILSSIPNSCKIDQMSIQYTNIFHYKTLQRLPKFGLLVWK
jgi:hypothetical protein